jgi:hydroxymethylglutaryl-CoA lyase
VSDGLPPAVSIREVAPRDGLQIEAPVPLAAKLELIAAIARTGVTRVEATSFVSPRAVPSLADAEQVAGALGRWPAITWSSLVASLTGARRAIDAGIKELEYVISVSDAHSRANVGRTTAEAVALIGPIAETVHTAGSRLEVIVAVAWDCPFTGPTPPGRTLAVLGEAVRRGADTLCVADTIGTATPPRVTALLRAAREVAAGLDVGAHFHNTRGTGIACALAAMQTGITSLDASVGGLGGCPYAPGATGNIATEELVYALTGSEVSTGLDLEAILEAAAVAERIVGHDLASSLYRAGGVNRARDLAAGWDSPVAPTSPA